MKKYSVYVQDKFYKIFETEFINDILTQVNQDIANGLVENFNSNLTSNIKIEPLENKDEVG